jgi:hypothetical protein
MTEQEIEKLAELIVKKIVNKQKELDDDFIGKWVAAGGAVEAQDGVDLHITEPESTKEGLTISKRYLENELQQAIEDENYVAAAQFKEKIAEIDKQLKNQQDE